MAGRRTGKSTAKKTGKPVVSRPKRAKAWPRARWIAYWGTVAAIWLTVILAGAVLTYISTKPEPELGPDRRSPKLTIMAADGSVLAQRGLRRGYVHLKNLPPYLKNAVIATEDRRFHYHFGVDPIGLARAMAANVRAGAIVQGGSTITQQLAKNLYLSSERTVARKLQEMVLAIWLEIRFSKDEILELYLNRVYFGAGAYGVEAAAQRYFGKPARQVNLAEATLLAGLLKAPSRYAPTRSPGRAEARAAQVVANMVDSGLLDPASAVGALGTPADVQAAQGVTGHEFAVDWVMELLPRLVGDQDANLVVETTIDPRLQRMAQRQVQSVMDGHGAAAKKSEAAALILDPRGRIKAIVGGRSYRMSQFNRALKASRQPGSAFKPFIWLAALENGYRPNSVVVDSPVSINGWRPRNYSGRHRGPVTLRQGLAHSINSVAVRLASDVGPSRLLAAAHRLGIESPLHDNPSIALGTGEVTLLELTSAYAPFANGGWAARPYIVTQVAAANGRVLYRRRREVHRRVIDMGHVEAMNDMLQATMTSGTGRAAALQQHPAAGKTGTTQNYRDAWFIGYTSHYVGGVWVGRDNGKPMPGITGGSVPAKIWRSIMTQAHSGLRPVALPARDWSDGSWRFGWWGDRNPQADGHNGDSFFDRVLNLF